jgi:hypothetical protein
MSPQRSFKVIYLLSCITPRLESMIQQSQISVALQTRNSKSLIPQFGSHHVAQGFTVDIALKVIEEQL